MNELAGARVLIVEDEAIVAFMLEDMLVELGCAVIGPALRLADALRLVEEEAGIDAAILDVNIGGERSDRVAEALEQRRIPFVFATGYGRQGMALTGGGGLVAKPYRVDDIEAALRRLLAGRLAPG
ncbi:MAG: response regulator [Porphyrobacter sp.]|nr:response regulator [Porphyrobacter sp.]